MKKLDGQFFAWQGWRMELPREWNPVRLEGDWKQGFASFADLQRARLGLRWSVVKERRFDPVAWAKEAIRSEVGLSSAGASVICECDRWNYARRYVDPKPRGRNVWVAHSGKSNRIVQLVHHADRRDSLFADTIITALVDLSQNEPMPWSIFDLSCVAPTGMTLRSHRLHAGDLRLEFRDTHRMISIRQIAVANVALARRSLEAWLKDEIRVLGKMYCATEPVRDENIVAQSLHRRRRFFFVRRSPQFLLARAVHDEPHNRLILVTGSDESLVEDIIRSIGWADDVEQR